MGETEKEFRARLTYLLVAHGGCRDVSMSWGPMSVVLRFKDRVGLEQSTAFDWPPARGAVDRIMSQVVGCEVYVHGMEIYATPAAPNVDPVQVDQRPSGVTRVRTGEYVASCEKCGAFNDRLVGLAGTRPEPWKHGLCSKCVDAERARAARSEPIGRRLESMAETIAALTTRVDDLQKLKGALEQEVVDLKEKLADLRLRAVANSKVAGAMLPAERRKESEPLDLLTDFDLLPDA